MATTQPGINPDEFRELAVSQVLRYLLGLPDAELALAMSILNRLGQETESPLLASCEISVAHIHFDKTVTHTIGRPVESSPSGAVEVLRQLCRIPIGQIIELDGLYVGLSRSPLFELVEICALPGKTTPTGLLLGWTIRCGQWAYWLLDEHGRAALCRTAAAYERANGQLMKRVTLRAAFSIITRRIGFGGREPVCLRDLVSVIEKVVPSTVNSLAVASLVANTVELLKDAGLVAIQPEAQAGRRGLLDRLAG